MMNRADLRPTVAAVVMLAVLAGAYEGARQLLDQSAIALIGSREHRAAPVPYDTVAAATTAKPAQPALAPFTAPGVHSEAEITFCKPTPLRFSRLSTELRFHRYTGMIGGSRITVELCWAHPDSISGCFYRWQGGPEYQLSYHGRRQGSLVFSVSHADDWRKDGTWQLTGTLGPMVRGAWLDSAGRRQPFTLRENYINSLPYEIQSLTLTGGQPIEFCGCREPSYTQDYLHLLGPRLPHPALWRLQPPPLARRKRLMRRELRQRYEVEGTFSYEIAVRLNDFQLLSYATYYEAYACGGGRQNKVQGTLLDLRTGREVSLGSQFTTNYWLSLRALATWHLQHDANFDFINKDQTYTWRWAKKLHSPTARPDTAYSTESWTRRELAPLTTQVVLTGAGLELTYPLVVLLDGGGSIEPDQTVLIPYAELRPLVRPGTPLARMLQARGMW